MSIIEEFFSNNMQALLDCIDDRVVIIDKSGAILLMNKANQSGAPFDIQNMIGKKIHEFPGLTTKQASITEILKIRQTMTRNVSYANGKTITWTSVPFFNKDGRLAMLISTGRDITQFIELASELKEKEQLIDKYSSQLKELKFFSDYTDIIYSSVQMHNVLNKAAKIKDMDSPVLIWGETGVGKEMIAKMIHTTGNRKDKPFVAINCAAIPDELLESELFGYEHGSFSGAKRSGKKGLIEEAHEGILFLDEIGELPMKMQSKLLRFLQERKFIRIGGNKEIKANVRIICATNLTQGELMNNGNFRRDLFYRISVFPIIVPALKERKDDIFPLMDHFIYYFNKKYKKQVHISSKFMARLYNHDWPGNIRELRNFVERYVALTGPEEISEEDFNNMLFSQREQNEEMSSGQEDKEGSIPSHWKLAFDSMPLKIAQHKLEEEMIKRAYEQTGSIAKAAARLGIDRSTIHRKLKNKAINL